MKQTLKRHLILAIFSAILLADLLFLLGKNIQAVFFPTRNIPPADGLPISPEWALGWVQVGIHLAMIFFIIMALCLVWCVIQARDTAPNWTWTRWRVMGLVAMLALTVPAWSACVHNVVQLANGKQTIEWNQWFILLSSVSQMALGTMTMHLLIKRWIWTGRQFWVRQQARWQAKKSSS